MRFLESLVVVLAVFTLPAEAKTLKVSEATASSSYPEEKGVNYDPKNVKDQKLSTAWFEGEDGGGLGSWIQLDLDGPQPVSELKIWNGYWLTEDLWKRNNRMQAIEVELSDGSKHAFTLKDAMEPETVRLPKTITTSSVKVRFKSIYKGSTYNDTAVSEIQVLDGSAAKAVPVQAYKASTTYPADQDGSYDAQNLGDGMIDSLWCEGSKGDGTGESVAFDFGGSRTLQSMTVRNGNTSSFQLYMAGSRAATLTLAFSDGTTKQVPLKSTVGDQLIPLGGKTTSSVKATVTAISKGSDTTNNDLCMSELTFSE
jgi:hypothetical protein